MTTFEGLDVEAVQAQGANLKSQSQHLDGIIQNIQGLVAQLEGVWHGQDSRDFQGWWEQQHRPALMAASQAVSGLGQSAGGSSGGGISGAGASATSTALAWGVGAAAVALGAGHLYGLTNTWIKDIPRQYDAFDGPSRTATDLDNLAKRFPHVAGGLDVADKAGTLIQEGQDAYKIGESVAQGHYMDAAGTGYDGVATGLEAYPPTYLYGANMAIWKSVVQDAQQVDWTMPMPSPFEGNNFRDIYVSGGWDGIKNGFGQIWSDL
jgi:uncharacterized protein YukE